jgi:hypothetical protein
MMIGFEPAPTPTIGSIITGISVGLVVFTFMIVSGFLSTTCSPVGAGRVLVGIVLVGDETGATGVGAAVSAVGIEGVVGLAVDVPESVGATAVSVVEGVLSATIPAFVDTISPSILDSNSCSIK